MVGISLNFSNMETICNTLTVNSFEEVIKLLVKEKLNKYQKNKIKELLIRMKRDLDELSSDLDILDTYFHEIQSIICVD